MIHKTHQIKLYPTKAQEILLIKSCGVRRKSWNWGLDMWTKMFLNGEKTSGQRLVKVQNSIKKVEFPYFKEVSKTAPQYALWDLQEAFNKYFGKIKDGTLEKERNAYIKTRLTKGLPIIQDKLYNFGKPKFKKKGIKDSYVAIENAAQFRQKKFKLHIPRIGKIKCAENIRFEGKVNNVTIKRIANNWFAYINLNSNETPIVSENQATVGVDFGIKSLAVCSNGKVFKNPKALKNNLKSLKRLQRGLSRKQKGSNNRRKQQVKVAKKHYKISCIRKNALHEVSSYLVNNFGKIVIEDLNIKGMSKNSRVAQSIIDCSWGELARQLTYKSMWNGIELIKADRYFASSAICSNCGHKKEKIKLSERVYNCNMCNHKQDRDLNAANNLANYSPTSKFEGS